MITELEKILGEAKLAYRESILIDNELLEDKLLSIISNLKLLINKTTVEKQILDINNIALLNNQNHILDEVNKIKKRVPKWLRKPTQFNSKILNTFMKLSNNNSYPISISSLRNHLDTLDRSKFITNYSQMKIIAERNHAKVFEEINGEITLWEPVADFIVDLFEEQKICIREEKNIMYDINKQEATSIINRKGQKYNLNPRNGGNMTLANKSNSKDVYWINIHLNKISQELHFILNDKDNREFTHLVIPPNTLNPNLFVVREDTTNEQDKIDIELSFEPSTYLKDIKSNGTNFDFNKHVAGLYTY